MTAAIADNNTGTLTTAGKGKARIRDQGIFFIVHYEDDTEVYISKQSLGRTNLRKVKLAADEKRD